MKEKELLNNSGALFLLIETLKVKPTLSPLGFGYLNTLKFETKNHELPKGLFYAIISFDIRLVIYLPYLLFHKPVSPSTQ